MNGFSDTLTLSRAEGKSSSFSVQQAKDRSAEVTIDWPVESDLAYRAHGLLEAHVQRPLPIVSVLEKRIPSYAGLGGGSSDAAGMLVGLNILYDLGLYEAELVGLGMRLGSDVGFLVRAQCGTNSAVVSGIGDRIEAAPLQSTLRIIITTLPVRCSTAEVYRRFDDLCPSARIEPERVWALAKSEAIKSNSPFNDLAEAAFDVAPLLRGLHEIYQRRIEWPVHVSGSGSSIFMVVETQEQAERFKNFIHQDIHAPAIITTASP